MSAPTWKSTQDAITAAIAAASGLASSKVLWKPANVNPVAADLIELSFSGAQVVGQDGIKTSTDLLRPTGTEIMQEVEGVREVTLLVECYTATDAFSRDAEYLAETTRTGLMLPSVRDLMAAVGVSPFDPGRVQYTPAIPSLSFRGRATLDVRCYMPAPTVVAYCGYIASVHGTATVSGTAVTF